MKEGLKNNLKKIFIITGLIVLLICFFVAPVHNGRTAFSILTYKDKYYSTLSEERQALYDKMQIEHVDITQRKTGTANFNTETYESVDDGSVLSNMEGIDVSEKDNYVRTFDKLIYTIEVGVGLNPNEELEDTTIKGGVIKIKAIMPKGPNGEEYGLWLEEAWMTNLRRVNDTDSIYLTAEYHVPSDASIVGANQELTLSFQTYGYTGKLTTNETKPKFEVWMEGNLPDNEESTIQAVTKYDEDLYISGKENYELEIDKGEVNMPATIDGKKGQYINFGVKVDLVQPYSYIDGLKGVSYPSKIDSKGKIKLGYYYKDNNDTSGDWVLIDENNTKSNGILNGTYLVAANVNSADNENAKPFIDSNKTDLSSTGIYCVYIEDDGSGWGSGQKICSVSGPIEASLTDNILEFTIDDTEILNNQSISGGYQYSIGFRKTFMYGSYAIELYAPYYDEGNSDYSYKIAVEATEYEYYDDTETLEILPDVNLTNNSTEIEFVQSASATIKMGLTYFDNRYNVSFGGSVAHIGSTGKLESEIVGNFGLYYGGIKRLINWKPEYFDISSVKAYTVDDRTKVEMLFGVYKENPSQGLTTDAEVNSKGIDDFDWYTSIDEAKENGVITSVILDDKSWQGYSKESTFQINYTHTSESSKIGDITFFRQKVYLYPDAERTIEETWYADNTEDSYTPSAYSGTSVEQAGSPPLAGKTLKMVGSKTGVDLVVNDKTSSGLVKQNYDVTDEIVNFKLTAHSFPKGGYSDGVIMKDDIYITAIIPKGLKFIESASSIKPERVHTISNGMTYVTWFLADQTIGDEIDPIYYSTEIDPFIENNTLLTTDVYIAAMNYSYYSRYSYKYDNTYYYYYYSTYEENAAKIKVSNLSGSSTRKNLSKNYLEVNEAITITDSVYNVSHEQLQNLKTIQRLPYNSDEYGSSFNGNYTLKITSLAEGQKIYYSTKEFESLGIESDTYGNLSAKNIDFSTDSNWTEVSVGDTIPSNITALGSLIGTLDTGTSKSFSYEFFPSGNKYQDKYAFRTFMTSSNLETTVASFIREAVVSDRKLSGIVFIDSNEDNLYSTDEKLYSNLEINLLDESNNEVATTKTDENGYYEFIGITKGNYYVQVATSENYEIVEKNVGMSNESSVFNTTGYTDLITTLNQELREEIVEEDNVNLGLRLKEATLITHHYIENTTTSLADSETRTLYWGENYETSAAEVDSNYELVAIPSNASGTVSGDVTVIYYYRLKTATITVHHYVEGTTTKLADDIVTTQNYTTTYTTKQAEVDSNYELVETPSNASGTVSGDVTVTYYYRLKTATITVHHYVEGTTTKLADDVTTTKKYTEKYETSSAEVDSNYELVATPPNAKGIVSGDVTVTYYYRLKTATITVHYYIKGTTTKLADDVTMTKKYTEKYETIAAVVNENYELVETPTNAFGTVSGDVIVIYYYQLKKATLTVNYYVEGTTTKLSKTIIEDMYWGDEYTTTSATDISKNYKLVENPNNATGIIKGNVEVNYYYTLKSSILTVNHYIEGTNTKLSQSLNKAMNWGDKYETSPATDISSNYELVATPTNASGTVSADTVTVNYYYKLKEAKLVVNYYKEGTTEKLSSTITKELHWGDEYTTTPASEINENYELVETPSNASGIISADIVTVNYYYKLKEAKLVVNYYKEGTTEKLSDTVTKEMHWGDEYTTASASDINKNYELVEKPANASGTIKGNVTVNYYYRLKEAKLTVNYYIEGTTTKLADSIIQELNWGDEYTTSPSDKVSTNYELIEIPNNATGVIKDNAVVVNYYYKLKTATLTVHHYIEGTTTKLTEDEISIVYWGEQYSTSKSNDISTNYELVNTPSNAKGTVSGDITVTYYYKLKTATIKVHYYVEGTTTKLSEDITFTKKYTEKYETNPATDISENYELISIPNNASGTVSGDVTVTYYYKLKSATLIVHHYIEGTTTKLVADEMSTIYWGDEYNTQASSNISTNYKLVSVPTNAKGTVKGNVTVTYYYKLKEALLTVKYLEYETNKEVAPTKTSTVYYGDQYTTSSSEEVTANYELLKKTENFEGFVNTDTIEVIYYYQKKDSSLETTITKEGPTEIISKSEKVAYKINYNAKITDYLGSATITIVDNLPYAIDTEKSNLDGGTYNEETKTITWQYIEDEVDASKETQIISVEKSISLVYKGIVSTERTMTNTASGNIKLDNNERNIEIQEVTYLKINGTIIVHHYLEGTTTKIAEDIKTNGLVGETYISNKIEKEGYKLTKEPKDKNHIYQDEITEVIYEYERLKFDIITKVNGDTGGNITGDEVVYYGDDSTKDKIVIIAAEDHIISKITINGKDYKVTNQKEMILEVIENITEDKLVEVTFISAPSNPETLSEIAIVTITGLGLLSTGAFVLVKKYKPRMKKI